MAKISLTNIIKKCIIKLHNIKNMENKNLLATLKALGLSDHGAKTYLKMLEIEAGNIMDIAQKANLHRPSVYLALAELKNLGLITEIKKGKRIYFQAESPAKLEFLTEKLKNNLGSGIEQLNELFKSKKHDVYVKFYEGKEGIRNIFSDIVNSLKKHDIFYRISSPKEIEKADTYLTDNYKKIRDEKQLERFVIASEEYISAKEKRMERSIKALGEEFAYDVTEIIYGNKVAYIDYSTETALVIENTKVAEFQKHIFKALYKRL